MADPNGWEVDAVFLQRLSGAAWLASGHDSAFGVPTTWRTGFHVAGGTVGAPMALGSIEFQQDQGRGDFLTIADLKDLEPGRIEPPEGDIPPEWAETPFSPFDWPRVQLRAVLTWVDGVHISPIRDVGVFPPAASADAEFLSDDGFAVLVTAGPGQIPGIFEDPHDGRLGVTGRRPTLLIDGAHAGPLAYGAELAVPGKGTYFVRAKTPDGTGPVRLLLEAA